MAMASSPGLICSRCAGASAFRRSRFYCLTQNNTDRPTPQIQAFRSACVIFAASAKIGPETAKERQAQEESNWAPKGVCNTC
jgi:hypothetical protein